MAWLENCPDCGNCHGKWTAAQSQQTWFGFNGPLSVESAATGGLCDPDTCSYGGWKYLVRSAVASASWNTVSQYWLWHAGLHSWSLETASGSFSASYAFTRRINPKSGCETLTVDSPSTTTVSGGFSDCSNAAPAFLAFGDPTVCDHGGGTIVYGHWIDLIASLGYSCGRYNGSSGGCGLGFDGSTGGGLSTEDAYSEYYYGYDFIFDPIVDDGTTAHIGIHGVYLRPGGYHFVGTYPPGTPPPDGDADGTVICAQVDITGSMDVDVNWSGPNTAGSCIALCEELLSHWDLCEHSWQEMPECPRGAFESMSTSIPLMTFSDECVADPPVVYSYVGSGDNEFLTWGAFITFTPGGDVFTMQKWGFRQGDFLPYGYQDGAPKTWRYLYQEWTVDICLGTGTYGCAEKTGAKGRRIIISPNGDCLPGADVYWKTTPFVPERTQGNIWQGVIQDAAADTYPGCYPDAPTSDSYVEPSSCACICPTTLACDRYAPGRCPFEPEDSNV